MFVDCQLLKLFKVALLPTTLTIIFKLLTRLATGVKTNQNAKTAWQVVLRKMSEVGHLAKGVPELKRTCFLIPQENCGHLFCSSDGWSCMSKNAPPADGTTCGPRNVSDISNQT